MELSFVQLVKDTEDEANSIAGIQNPIFAFKRASYQTLK
jgi:hypothetical protein